MRSGECGVPIHIPSSQFPTRMSGRRDSNPRLSPWKGDALPLSYSRKHILEFGMRTTEVEGSFRNSTPPIPHSLFHTPKKWAGEDSNLRRHKPADLQSAAFVHFATDPQGLFETSTVIWTARLSRPCLRSFGQKSCLGGGRISNEEAYCAGRRPATPRLDPVDSIASGACRA